jgi:hypothetical protein
MKRRQHYAMAVQGAAVLVGAALLALGIVGFIPGVTTHFDRFAWTGQHTGAYLFGVFAVCGLHSMIHMAFGFAGLFLARTYALARAYLLGGGLVYLALFACGLTVTRASLDVMAFTTANNWLHLVIGGVMVLLGLTLAAQHDPTKPRVASHT